MDFIPARALSHLQPVAPSAIPLGSGQKTFNCPRALDGDEIAELIRRFAFAAGRAKEWGFTEEESMQVIQALQAQGINLIEVSGGNYENPSMVGTDARQSTVQREAWFLDYAEKARKLLQIPLVVTGGFRSGRAMNDAQASGATDMIGLARPLAVQPDMANKLLPDQGYRPELKKLTTGVKALDFMAMLDITWYEHQLALIGAGKPAQPNMSAWRSVLKTFGALGSHAFQRRRA